MPPRVSWPIAAVTTFAMVAVLSTAARSQTSSTALPRRQSQSAGVGPVSKSVIASWQAHGADDGVLENAQPNDPFPPLALRQQDWILDLAVFWRWPDDAPEFQQGSVGGDVNGTESVHRIVIENRELRIQFDPQAHTVRIAMGPLVQLDGANVLMLDVGERGITVVGTATVEPRYREDPEHDPMATLVERSPEVAAFVNRTR